MMAHAGKPLVNWTVNHLPAGGPHDFDTRGNSMNSNQRSEGNNQSNNGGNEKTTSSSRSGVEETNARQNKLSQESQHDASMQTAEPQDASWGREGRAQPTGTPGHSEQSEHVDLSHSGMKGRGQEGMQGPGMPNERRGSQSGISPASQQYEHGIARASTDRAGSQTGSKQSAEPGVHESNDVAGGLPKSPGGKHLAADQKMDDDTGLSNTANRQSAIDEGSKQTQQSNVGRRSDMTPD